MATSVSATFARRTSGSWTAAAISGKKKHNDQHREPEHRTCFGFPYFSSRALGGSCSASCQEKFLFAPVSPLAALTPICHPLLHQRTLFLAGLNAPLHLASNLRSRYSTWSRCAP